MWPTLSVPIDLHSFLLCSTFSYHSTTPSLPNSFLGYLHNIPISFTESPYSFVLHCLIIQNHSGKPLNPFIIAFSFFFIYFLLILTKSNHDSPRIAFYVSFSCRSHNSCYVLHLAWTPLQEP